MTLASQGTEEALSLLLRYTFESVERNRKTTKSTESEFFVHSLLTTLSFTSRFLFLLVDVSF